MIKLLWSISLAYWIYQIKKYHVTLKIILKNYTPTFLKKNQMNGKKISFFFFFISKYFLFLIYFEFLIQIATLPRVYIRFVEIESDITRGWIVPFV